MYGQRTATVAAISLAVAVSSSSAMADSALADEVRSALEQDFMLSWFDTITVTPGRQFIEVTAEGEGIDISRKYRRDGDSLGDLVEQDFSSDGNPEIVQSVVGEELYGRLLAGGTPSDISIDYSCDGNECDFSVDASGSGFDFSLDADCVGEVCEYSYDGTDEALEAEIERRNELADVEADRTEAEREAAEEAAEEAKDAAEDAADDAADAAEGDN